MYETLQVKVKGIAPLLMHNGQLSNPMNKWAKAMKEISGKRKKTDADHIELARIEFLGGLYVNDKGHPVIPGENIEAMLAEAGAMQRLKKQFRAGVLSDGEWPVEYKGPKSADALWKDENFVDRRGAKLNGKVRIERTRPIFREWGLAFTISYLPDLLNKDQVLEAVRTAGRIIGLGDYKPKFGRFELAA